MGGFGGLLEHDASGGGFNWIDLQSGVHNLVSKVKVGNHLLVESIHRGAVVLTGSDGNGVEGGDKLVGKFGKRFEAGHVDLDLDFLGIGIRHHNIS